MDGSQALSVPSNPWTKHLVFTDHSCSSRELTKSSSPSLFRKHTCSLSFDDLIDKMEDDKSKIVSRSHSFFFSHNDGQLRSKMYLSWGLHFLLLFTFLFCWEFSCLYNWLPISPLEGEKQNQQLRCGAIFKHPLLCELSTRAFLSGIQKKEKKRTPLNWGNGGLLRGKQNSSFSLEITLTFSKTQEVLGLENYPQL